MQQAKRKDYPEKLVSTKYNETNSEDIDWQPAPRLTPDDAKGNVKCVYPGTSRHLWHSRSRLLARSSASPRQLHSRGGGRELQLNMVRDGDGRSLWRALDQKLYLIVKHQSGDWMFPHVQHQQGQTMRQAAETALERVALVEDCYVIGNPPSAHFVVPGTSPPIMLAIP
jgi:hypothetical protein